MTQVYWLEQTNADLPQGDDWLGTAELERLGQLRFEKRRADWRLGRWTAKRAVAACLNIPRYTDALEEIEVRPAPSGAPEVLIGRTHAPVAISISHREGQAACAVAPAGTRLGCDLEAVEPRIDAFVSDYFTPGEQSIVRQASQEDRFATIALVWSAKESALKALREGLRLSTLSLNVSLCYTKQFAIDAWQPMTVQHIDGQRFPGWWQQSGNVVRTLVASPPSASPLPLILPSGPPRLSRRAS